MNGLAGVSALALAAAVLVWPTRSRAPRGGEGLRSVRRWRLLAGRPGAPGLGRRVVVMVAVGVALAVLAQRWWPPPVTVGVGILAAAGGVVVLGRLEPAAVRERRLRLVLELPPVLDLLVAGLTAGRPLRVAVADVVAVSDGPLAEDLGRVVAAVGLGRPEPDAWLELRGHPVLGPLAVDLARSAASGTRLVEVLRVHARVARRRRHGELEAMAKAVGVRCVVPLMVCFLPAFLAIGVVPIIASVLMAAFTR